VGFEGVKKEEERESFFLRRVLQCCDDYWAFRVASVLAKLFFKFSAALIKLISVQN